MPLKRQGIPETPPEMSERDKIARGILLGLADQEFRVGMLTNGEIAVNMTNSDYIIRITKKRERVM